MKILEILLPKEIKDRDISPKHAQKIDMLQKRMNGYVDRICKPGTSPAAVEFLKAKLKDDYHELKDVFKEVAKESATNEAHINQQMSLYKPDGTTYRQHQMPTLKSDPADDAEPLSAVSDTSELDTDAIDRKNLVALYMKSLPSKERTVLDLVFLKGMTQAEAAEKLGYSTGYVGQIINRAIVRIKHKTKYGKLPSPNNIMEAVHKLPLSDADFKLVKELMSNKIPAIVAPIYIQEIIDDDEFNDMLIEFGETNPNMDIRPHLYEWFKRVMPDQLYRFNDNGLSAIARDGQQSVIHGYDPHMYHGSVNQRSGDAYGSWE